MTRARSPFPSCSFRPRSAGQQEHSWTHLVVFLVVAAEVAEGILRRVREEERKRHQNLPDLIAESREHVPLLLLLLLLEPASSEVLVLTAEKKGCRTQGEPREKEEGEEKNLEEGRRGGEQVEGRSQSMTR